MIEERIPQCDLSSLNWDWLRKPMRGIESDSLMELYNKIKKVSLFDALDSWIWKGDESKTFCVQSLRMIMTKVDTKVGSNSFFYGLVAFRSKSLVLHGDLFLDKLHVAYNLTKRGVNLNSTLYPLCMC